MCKTSIGSVDKLCTTANKNVDNLSRAGIKKGVSIELTPCRLSVYSWDYPEQLMQPSSIEQTGPSTISSALCSICSGITGSMFLPAWFSTVNLTA